jgi:hypothetical protein
MKKVILNTICFLILLSESAYAGTTLSVGVDYAEKSWGATVIEVGIPGHDGDTYDIIWDFIVERKFTESIAFPFLIVWNVDAYIKKTSETSYSYYNIDNNWSLQAWNTHPYADVSSTGVYYSGNGYKSPNVPDTWITDYLSVLDSEFDAPWTKPDGTVEDRTSTGDWFNTSAGIAANGWGSTHFSLEVDDWDDRDPFAGDHVQIEYVGQEGDVLWSEWDCVNAQYSMTETVTPTDTGGTFALSGPPDMNQNCGEFGPPGDRLETNSSRDHLLQDVNASQVLAGP